MKFANGETYNGSWQNDVQTGKGIYTWIDGAIYEGGFIEGKKTGEGNKEIIMKLNRNKNFFQQRSV